MYSFCRYVDDLVDEAGARSTPEAGLLDRLGALLETIEAGRSDLPFAPAFAEANRQFQIDRGFYLDLIGGCCLDERPPRIATFEELELYCYHVASVVGLMMAKIFGLQTLEGVHRAVEMGIAMQLTNILRDIREDLEQDRIYLPADELRAAGLDEDSLRRGLVDERWRSFLARQIERARAYYRSGEAGIDLLARDGSRFTARLMSRIYGAILDEIEAADYDVFAGRVYVPTHRKVLILLRTLASP